MSCQQNPNLELSVCRRVTMFLAGILECMLFGGVVFGWPQLVHLLKMDSVYANLCSDVNTAAGDGLNQYSAVPYGGIFNNSRCMALNVTPIFLPYHQVRSPPFIRGTVNVCHRAIFEYYEHKYISNYSI